MNHGTVVSEISEYQEPGRRAVVCELQSGAFAVECYTDKGNGLKLRETRVYDALSDARSFGKDWV